MKKLILTSFIFLSIITANAEKTKNNESKVKSTAIRLNLLLGPSLKIEYGKTKKSSTVFSVGLIPIYQKIKTTHHYRGKSSSREKSELSIYPYISVEPRFYRNGKKREGLGEKAKRFSGGYAGFPISIIVIENSATVNLGGVYGYQGNIGRIAYWNIAVGIGGTKHKEDINLGFIGEVGIGFILN